MNLITPVLFTLAIIGTAAASSSTPSVRAIKGVESTRNLQYGGYGGGVSNSCVLWLCFFPRDDSFSYIILLLHFYSTVDTDTVAA